MGGINKTQANVHHAKINKHQTKINPKSRRSSLEFEGTPQLWSRDF